VEADGRIHDFYLGAHAPDLTAADISLIHRLWLEVTEKAGTGGVHHRDIVTTALSRMAEELGGPGRDVLLARFTALQTDRQETPETHAQESQPRDSDVSILAQVREAREGVRASRLA
jgi:hypothetical protein